MKPGLVKIAKNENVLMMPNLMMIDFDVYKLIQESMNINQDIQKLEDGDKKKEELALKSQNVTIQAIDLMKETYEEYAEFSKGFGIIDHIRVIASIGKGVKALEIKEMVETSMIVEEPDEKDIEASKESDGFLS